MRTFLLSALMSTSLACAAASAATLNTERGEVLINRGEGFRRVAKATAVVPGDQIMANPRGKGHVQFSPTCQVIVEPGSIFVVPSEPPCKATGRYVPTGGSLKDGPQPPPERSHDHYLIGAAIVGAAVGTVILLRDKDKPASP